MNHLSTSSSRRRARRTWRVDSALVSAVLVLLVGEGLSRTGALPQRSNQGRHAGPAQGYYPPPHVFDAECGYRYQPNYDGLFVRRDFETRMVTNPWGFRDDDMNPQKPDDVFRVAILGDSMLAANEAAVTQIWANRLDKIIPAIDGRQVEFLNFGIDGYLLWNMTGLLEDVAPQFRPDLVVLWVTPRQLSIGLPRFRSVTRHGQILESSDAQILNATVRLENRRWQSVRDWIGDRSKLGQWLNRSCGKVKQSNLLRIAARQGAEKAYNPVDLIERMRRTCGKVGAAFVILLREGHGQDESPIRDPQIPLYSDKGIVVDFDQLRWPHDAHFDIEGHRIYAEAIAPIMRNIVRRAMAGDRQAALR